MNKLVSMILVVGLGSAGFEAKAQTSIEKEESRAFHSLLPDRLLLQHSAYAGAAAIGLGYSGKHFAFDMLYGFTPESEVGDDVQQFDLKGLWYLFTVDLSNRLRLTPYLGLGLYYSPDAELFVKIPSQYPEAGYYPPTALRPALLGGLEIRTDSAWGFGLEYSLLDSELAYARDKGGVPYAKVGSVGFNVQWTLL